MLRGARSRNSELGTQSANCEAPERTGVTDDGNHVYIHVNAHH